MERVGQRGLYPFCENSGAAWVQEAGGRSQAGPAHRWAVMIITILQFEMYSGGFSKYEDLPNEF